MVDTMIPGHPIGKYPRFLVYIFVWQSFYFLTSSFMSHISHNLSPLSFGVPSPCLPITLFLVPAVISYSGIYVSINNGQVVCISTFQCLLQFHVERILHLLVYLYPYPSPREKITFAQLHLP